VTPTRDLSRPFSLLVAISWAAVVALPIFISLALGQPFGGVPLAGILLWFGVVRFGRWLSPASRADALARRGRYAEALALCNRALAISGEGAWIGARRLVWLNRRTTALLALGRADGAAVNALDALRISADPETLGNVSLALLRMNRYDEAEAAARLALSLTRERSVLAHTTLAHVLLARDKPAEAEAMARAGAEDARALQPLMRQEHYVLCLAAICRGVRLIKPGSTAPHAREVTRYRAELRSASRRSPTLRAVAQAEEAERLSAAPEHRGRARELLDSAMHHSPDYALWLIAQPGTFTGLANDEHHALYVAQAAERMATLQASGPSPETVAQALAASAETAEASPAVQSSTLAIYTQIATLGGTFLLLLTWTLRFVLFS
jgi:tetratricopeptide (TPR) repeat protein